MELALLNDHSLLFLDVTIVSFAKVHGIHGTWLFPKEADRRRPHVPTVLGQVLGFQKI